MLQLPKATKNHVCKYKRLVLAIEILFNEYLNCLKHPRVCIHISHITLFSQKVAINCNLTVSIMNIQNLTWWKVYILPLDMWGRVCQVDAWLILDEIDGLVQDCSISIANALGILQSYTRPSKCNTHIFYFSLHCKRCWPISDVDPRTTSALFTMPLQVFYIDFTLMFLVMLVLTVV